MKIWYICTMDYYLAIKKIELRNPQVNGWEQKSLF